MISLSPSEKNHPDNRAWLFDAIERWKADMLDGGAGARRIAFSVGYVLRVIKALKPGRDGLIDPERLERYLRRKRDDGLYAGSTSNDILEATKRFYRWLDKERLIDRTPINHVRKVNAELGRPYIRRALSNEDVAKLIHAAENGKDWYTVPGYDRAILYRILVNTGLRFGEALKLCPCHINTEKRFVQPPKEKNGAHTTIPLRADLCEILRPWLAGKRPTSIIWKKPMRRDSCVFLDEWVPVCEGYRNMGKQAVRWDMAAAGIPIRDEKGHVFDLHSLRHTFITNLVKAALPLKTVQILARHTNIAMTMKYYVHVSDDELADAIEKLPALGG